MIATISPASLADLRRRGERVTLVDVRAPAEFGEAYVDFAHNIPLDLLDPREIAALGAGPVYFVCTSSGRSQTACERLVAGLAGFVGCGLVFPGVTDTCGMAMLLARMTWNQAGGSAAACSRAALGALVLALASGTAVAQHTTDSLDVVQQAIARQAAVIVDVREREEWQEGDTSPGLGACP